MLDTSQLIYFLQLQTNNYEQLEVAWIKLGRYPVSTSPSITAVSKYVSLFDISVCDSIAHQAF